MGEFLGKKPRKKLDRRRENHPVALCFSVKISSISLVSCAPVKGMFEGGYAP